MAAAPLRKGIAEAWLSRARHVLAGRPGAHKVIGKPHEDIEKSKPKAEAAGFRKATKPGGPPA